LPWRAHSRVMALVQCSWDHEAASGRGLGVAVAVEPDPRSFDRLQGNVRQNGMQDRAVCLSSAASDRKGEAQFELCDSNPVNHHVRTIAGAVAAEFHQESQRPAITVRCEPLGGALARVPDRFPWASRCAGSTSKTMRGVRLWMLSGCAPRAFRWSPRAGPMASPGRVSVRNSFCAITTGQWWQYWPLRRGRYVKHSIKVLGVLFEELGPDNDAKNVILTP